MNDSDGKPNVLVIALIAVAAVMGLGYIVILLGWCVHRRKEKKARGIIGVQYSKTGAEFAPQGAMYESDKAASMTHSDPYDPHH